MKVQNKSKPKNYTNKDIPQPPPKPEGPPNREIHDVGGVEFGIAVIIIFIVIIFYLFRDFLTVLL